MSFIAEKCGQSFGALPEILAPLRGAELVEWRSGGVAALNPRLISSTLSGCIIAQHPVFFPSHIASPSLLVSPSVVFSSSLVVSSSHVASPSLFVSQPGELPYISSTLSGCSITQHPVVSQPRVISQPRVVSQPGGLPDISRGLSVAKPPVTGATISAP